METALDAPLYLHESGGVGECKDGADACVIQARYSSHFIAFR